MHKFLKSFALGALVLGAASAANAVTITLSAAGVQTTAEAGATTIDFESGCGYAACSGDYEIHSGSLSGKYAAPAGDSSKYVTVPNPYSNGSALFDLGTTSDYFGLYWGSIDAYNSLDFLLNGVSVAHFTGSDIVVPANGNQTSDMTNRYVNFYFGQDLFNQVRFTSTSYAFESDNHAYRSVPEPTTLALLGLGLLALVFMRSKKLH